MSEPLSPERHEAAQVTRTQPEAEPPPPPHASYTYRSAEITEREGRVPRWLWGVAIGLLIWGVYYLITYWRPPA
jgi:hypothetical protein